MFVTMSDLLTRPTGASAAAQDFAMRNHTLVSTPGVGSCRVVKRIVGGELAVSGGRGRQAFRVQQIRVDRIRPEEGLGRKRDREGHRELCRSIEQFGVLTPITVRRAPDSSEEFLLIKGQGRTLACNILGISTIPAVVVDDKFADTEKVQQFLVENVARLKMSPVDRALLIAHARREGEETAEVAKRFGVSPSTVRRLELQLDGATSGEVSALRASNLSLSLHAVIARHVAPGERADLIHAIGPTGIRSRDLEELLRGIDWSKLVELGSRYREDRLRLITWACQTLATLPRDSTRQRLAQLALHLPSSWDDADVQAKVAGR
jgi:ParB/RepB/Spo0J family partition protein